MANIEYQFLHFCGEEAGRAIYIFIETCSFTASFKFLLRNYRLTPIYFFQSMFEDDDKKGGKVQN